MMERATFVLDQNEAKIRHPYDLDADDIPGIFEKHDQVRFYEAGWNKKNELHVSSQVHPIKGNDGQVIDGNYKQRCKDGRMNVAADIDNVYAVIRRRGEHKRTRKDQQISFKRNIIFIMTLTEYNKVYRNLKNLKEFTLSNPFIILSYDHDAESDSIQISQDSHGNTKAETAFRPTAHSTKQEVKERMSKDGRAPRLVLDDMGFDSNILGRETQSDFPRNTKQIKNYRFNYREKVDDGDDYISSLIMDIVQQNEETAFLPLDPNQPFLREIIFRNQKKPNYKRD